MPVIKNMSTRHEILKISLLTFAAFGCFALLWLGAFSFFWMKEPDCIVVKSKEECLDYIRYLIDELDRQDVSLKDYDLYRVNFDNFMSCPADEELFEKIESFLGLKELDSRQQQVSNLYRSVSQTPITMPSKASARFYEGTTGSSPGDTLEDNFFIVAYDKDEGRFVLWFYTLF